MKYYYNLFNKFIMNSHKLSITSSFNINNIRSIYCKWINLQNKLQKNCNHITMELFEKNVHHYLNNKFWWENDPSRIKTNKLWLGHID